MRCSKRNLEYVKVYDKNAIIQNTSPLCSDNMQEQKNRNTKKRYLDIEHGGHWFSTAGSTGREAKTSYNYLGDMVANYIPHCHALASVSPSIFHRIFSTCSPQQDG